MRSKFYSTAAWKKLRQAHLVKEPLCQFCLAVDRVNATNLIVDHIRPHRGDRKLFYDSRNLQTLCEGCHNGRKRLKDLDGFDPQIGSDGWPIDQDHPFHSGKARKKKFLQIGIPIGIQPRQYPTHVICGPPGAGKFEYAFEKKKRAGIGLVLSSIVTGKRMGLRDNARHTRRQVAEAEIVAMNRFQGSVWILRELPHRKHRVAWSDALEDPDCLTVLARPEAECFDRLEREGRLTETLRQRVRSWWKIYRA